MNADERRSGMVIEDYSFPFGFRLLEVYQEAAGFSGDFKVVQTLGGVFGGEAVYAFQFDEEFVLDQDVGLVAANLAAFVVDFVFRLGYGWNAPDRKLTEKSSLVNLFEESGAEGIGDFEDALRT
jgi:hypothetical protein